MSTSAKTRILTVDDSAFARKVVREMLSSSPLIEVVGAARDGEEALELVETLKPDLVVCDLIMPKLNGVEFVKTQMQRRPLPILILSSAAENAVEVIDALNAGAFDVVRKPSATATDSLRTIQDELVESVLAAAAAPRENLMAKTPVPEKVVPAKGTFSADVVVIGISTGGPQALRSLMPRFPADFPVPIAIVLHMPVGYTALFAEKLSEICALEIKEAKHGDLVRPGRALLAQAGRHLSFKREPDGTISAQLSIHPVEKIHRPSVDVLFKSATEIYGSRVLGVVMTGMGNDGMEGAGWIKAAGGSVLTEDEKSCVIYGMPRSVVEAGLSDFAVSLDKMADVINEHL